MKHRILFATIGLCLWGATELRAQQSVGVGTATPDPKAALDVSATDKGVLLPRLTKAQRLAISAPPQGLTVFQTAPDSVGFWFYSGTRWQWTPDAQSAAGTLGATNGLTRTGNVVGLGGTLTSPTTVAQGGNDLSFTGGNVGIGVTSPAQRLEVAGNARVTGGVAVDAADAFNGTYSPTGGVLRFGGDGSGEGLGSRRTSGANQYGLDLYTSFTSRLSITGSGLVGIGTSAPSTNLHVVGNARITGLTTAGVVTTDASGNLSSVGASTLADNLGNHTAAQNLNLGAFQLVGNGGSSGLSIANSGWVGIGTAGAPSSQLQVVGTTTTQRLAFSQNDTDKILLTATQPGSKISHSAGWSVDYYGGPGTSGLVEGQHRFFTTTAAGWTEQLTIRPTGNVGVGINLPTARLDVNGTTRLRGLTTAGVVTTDASGNLSSQTIGSIQDNLGNHTATQNLDLGAFQLVGNGGVGGIFITSPGNVGVGTTLTNGYRLNVNGTMYVGSRIDAAGYVQAAGLRLPGAFDPDPAYVGATGNYLSFGHTGVSEDFIGYKNNTFYLKDSPLGGDVTDPNLVVGGNVGIGVDPAALREPWLALVRPLVDEATLRWPAEAPAFRTTGRSGLHSEHLGYLLAEMQSLARQHPGATW